MLAAVLTLVPLAAAASDCSCLRKPTLQRKRGVPVELLYAKGGCLMRETDILR